MDLNNKVTRVPCVIVSELPHKPPLLAIKDKLKRSMQSMVGMVGFAGILFGSFVALDLIFDFV